MGHTKNMHYILVAQYQKVVADYSKSKGSYEQFTSEILKNLKKGRFILPYQE
jgi:hypothetical protein